MPAAVPVIEVADHPHALGIRRPDRERRAAGPLADAGTQHLPQPLVPALGNEVQVDLAERGRMPVRIIADDLARRPPRADGEPGGGYAGLGPRRGEDAVV